MVVDATGLLGKRFGPASDYTESPIQLHKPSFFSVMVMDKVMDVNIVDGARDELST